MHSKGVGHGSYFCFTMKMEQTLQEIEEEKAQTSEQSSGLLINDNFADERMEVRSIDRDNDYSRNDGPPSNEYLSQDNQNG